MDDFLVEGRHAGFMDPRTWGLRRHPSHVYVVREGCSGQPQLQRIKDPADSHPYGPCGPTIWAYTPDDSGSGLRVIEPLWLYGEGGRSGDSALCRQPQEVQARPLHRCGLDAPSAAA